MLRRLALLLTVAVVALLGAAPGALASRQPKGTAAIASGSVIAAHSGQSAPQARPHRRVGPWT